MLDQAARRRLMQADAERRFERWLLSEELRRYMLEAEDVSAAPSQTGPYIAISREAGAGGAHIARMVGRKLAWDVLDKEVLDFIAARYKVPRDLLERVDEAKARIVQDAVRAFFATRRIGQSEYAYNLERTVHLAALHGRVVFVGRGAHVMLPRAAGMAVRIIAPRELRIEWTMERRGLDRKKATKLVDDTDAGREQFCQHHFQRDNRDSHLFDFVINVGRLSAEGATRQIIEGYAAIHGSFPAASA